MNVGRVMVKSTISVGVRCLDVRQVDAHCGARIPPQNDKRERRSICKQWLTVVIDSKVSTKQNFGFGLNTDSNNY